MPCNQESLPVQHIDDTHAPIASGKGVNKPKLVVKNATGYQRVLVRRLYAKRKEPSLRQLEQIKHHPRKFVGLTRVR